MTYITKSEFARRHGFSKQYVTELIRKGIIDEEKSGLLNSEKSDQDLFIRRSINQNTHKHGSDANRLQELFFQARLQNEIEKGKILKLERAEKEQSLISADKVQETLFRKGRVIRDAFLNLPDRVSSIIATMQDAREIHILLTKEIRTILEELSNG